MVGVCNDVSRDYIFGRYNGRRCEKRCASKCAPSRSVEHPSATCCEIMSTARSHLTKKTFFGPLAATVAAAGAGGLGAAPGARLYKKAHKSGVDHQTCTFIAHYVLFLDRVTRFGQTERDVHEELCIFAVSKVSRYAAQACANG